MARLNRVKKARKAWTCGGEHTIPKGDPYVWWQHAYGTRNVRCMEHIPRRSQYGTRSAYIATAWDIEDDLAETDWSEYDPDSAADEIEEAAQTIRDEIAEMLRGSAEAMVEGFGHETYQSEELGERADNFEAWADELERAASTIRDFDPEEDGGDLIECIESELGNCASPE